VQPGGHPDRDVATGQRGQPGNHHFPPAKVVGGVGGGDVPEEFGHCERRDHQPKVGATYALKTRKAVVQVGSQRKLAARAQHSTGG